MRLRRIAKAAIYKEDLAQLIVPLPRGAEPCAFLVRFLDELIPRRGVTASLSAVHRRLLTILFSATGLFALSAATSGCSTVSDADAAARVDEAELSSDGLSDLIDAIAIPQGQDPHRR